MASYRTAMRVWTLGRMENMEMVRRAILPRQRSPQTTPALSPNPSSGTAATTAVVRSESRTAMTGMVAGGHLAASSLRGPVVRQRGPTAMSRRPSLTRSVKAVIAAGLRVVDVKVSARGDIEIVTADERAQDSNPLDKWMA